MRGRGKGFICLFLREFRRDRGGRGGLLIGPYRRIFRADHRSRTVCCHGSSGALSCQHLKSMTVHFFLRGFIVVGWSDGSNVT